MNRHRFLYPAAEGGGGDEETTERLVAAEAMAQEALARYRDLVSLGPGLVAGMVQGDTVEEIDRSAEAARQAYQQISRQVVEQYERQVPTGNPARSAGSVGAEGLSPEAKIALGLSRQ
jgi:hypothetical protein